MQTFENKATNILDYIFFIRLRYMTNTNLEPKKVYMGSLLYNHLLKKLNIRQRVGKQSMKFADMLIEHDEKINETSYIMGQ